MKDFPVTKIKSVEVNAGHLGVELIDGRSVRLPLSLFPTLAEATPKQRAKWELCGGGTGIEWPLLDYHLSAEGLLRGEAEAPGLRRAKKNKYPDPKPGSAGVLAETPALPSPPRTGRGIKGEVSKTNSQQSGTRETRPSTVIDTRVIYCGDNLEQLRKLPDACVDLIYIDPPFNSNRNYEVFWGETKEKRAFDDRHASTQAYIDYMRPRCVELARVLKKTGSFYYHCDWHASHYVKVMLDQIFGENSFQAEIVWKRTSAHGDTRGYGHVTDSIFFYAIGKDFTWNRQIRPYEKDYVEKFYRNVDPATGKRFMLDNLTGAGTRNGETGQVWRGVDVTKKGRHWIRPPSELDKWDASDLIYWPPKGGTPRFKRFLNEDGGLPLDNIWMDIPAIGAHSQERLGYPTQKPLALLERIIKASSNENGIVLDAFCGCGTALVAAQKSKRQWIGIDISPTACRVMAKRLRDVCGLPEDKELWKIGRGFVVRDLPWTEEKLRAIPPFEFENWAVIALGGIPNKVQVGDMGIDGRIFPVGSEPKAFGEGELSLQERWYPIQVKQKDRVGRPDIDSFETALRRSRREKGFVVAFDFSTDALREIDRFFKEEHAVIIPLTVREILDEQIARKLA